MARFLYRGGQRDTEPDASSRIMTWCREILALDEDAAVSVAQIACGEPECGGAETVVMIMVPGRKTEAVRLKGAMAEVTRASLAEALARRTP